MTARAVLWVACLLAEAAAFVAAARSARLTERPDHDSKVDANVSSTVRPLLLLLAFAVLSDVWIAAARALVFTDELHPVREAVARLGWPARGLYHLETALVMGWPAGLAAACLRVFGRPLSSTAPLNIPEGKTGTEPGFSAETAKLQKRAILQFDVLAGLYLGAVVGLAVAFPLAPGWTAVVLKVWEVLCVTFAAGAIVASYRRARRGEAVWTRTHGALLVLATVEAAVVAIGPFARPNVFEGWIVARAQYAFGMLAVAALLSWPRRSTGPR